MRRMVQCGCGADNFVDDSFPDECWRCGAYIVTFEPMPGDDLDDRELDDYLADIAEGDVWIDPETGKVSRNAKR